MIDDQRYSGGDGASMETAVVVHENTSSAGICAEHDYISLKHGTKGEDWMMANFLPQMLMRKNGRHFDVLTVRLSDGSQRKFYFDVSEFFGKE